MKFSSKKTTALILIPLFLMLIVALIWNQYFTSDSTTPQVTTSTAETAFHFPISPIYLQHDPRWKDDKIGGSEETLGEVGCFVAGVSMALAHYSIDLNPKQLNELLKAHDGYTEQGWVKWGTVSKITNHQIYFYVPNHPHLILIDAALKASEPVLAKIRLYGIIPHWVLIVGKEAEDYYVKDPLGDGQSLDKLSDFKSKIYAIRVIKKLEP
jgi:hypothetical protein